MLRAFRFSDIPEYAELYRKFFPDEARVLLTDSTGFARVIARAFRWDARFVLGLLRLFGRPIGDFLALEVDGRLAGVTLVFFDPPVGHIASVVVDTPYRRHGYARQMVEAAEASARRRGCQHAMLEVIEDNTPAFALYDSMGYRKIREVAWLYRDVGPELPPLPEAPTGEGARALRKLRRGDGPALLPLAVARQTEEERRIRPMRPGAFRVPPPIIQALGGESEAIVRIGPGGPEGIVRSSTSGAMPSGHLNAPLVADGVSERDALDLLDAGLAWFRTHPVRRVICEAPEDDERLGRLLAARGFQRGLGIHALAKAL